MSDDLRKKLIKIAYENPQYRAKILPVLKGAEKTAAVPTMADVEDKIKGARQGTKDFINHMIRVKSLAQGLEDLIATGEAGRLDRSEKVDVKATAFDGNSIMASVKGSKQDYNVKISLFPSRGFNCQCEDKSRRGRSVGPCKHVLAVAKEFWDSDLKQELDRAEKNAGALLDGMTLKA